MREFVLKLGESLIFWREVDKFGKNMEEQGYLGSKVFYRKWAKTSNPKSTLIVIHGLGEHSGRYKQLAEYFCAQDLVVLCPGTKLLDLERKNILRAVYNDLNVLPTRELQ